MKHGVLLLHKPTGMTSSDLVRRIKPMVRPRKVGHTGTLDPMAEGLLPLTIGEATKLTRWLQAGDKRYQATLKLGQATDTLDKEGQVTEEKALPMALSAEKVESVLAAFRGPIQQIPPMFSALHHKGKRLHELARQGLEVERPPRSVTIHALELLGLDKDELELDVRCGSGTYIRSLGADIAVALGTVGHLIALKRTESCGWRLDDALRPEELSPGHIDEGLLALPQVLKRFIQVQVPDSIGLQLSQGQRLDRDALRDLGVDLVAGSVLCFATAEGAPYILAELKDADEEPAMDILRVLMPRPNQ